MKYNIKLFLYALVLALPWLLVGVVLGLIIAGYF